MDQVELKFHELIRNPLQDIGKSLKIIISAQSGPREARKVLECRQS
jgi:hypothetical protein